ncbi:MAG: DNA-binding protein [Anaerovorax sp.]|nr:DNA-binding protein [Anaerovorax sp.]
MNLEWMSPEEAGRKWGIKARRVQFLCSVNRINGVIRMGRMWLIPKNASKPIDGRTKIAKQHNCSPNIGENTSQPMNRGIDNE